MTQRILCALLPCIILSHFRKGKNQAELDKLSLHMFVTIYHYLLLFLYSFPATLKSGQGGPPINPVRACFWDSLTKFIKPRIISG